MNRRHMATLWLLAMTWGASFLFIRVGVETIPPSTFVLGRIGLAAIILFVIIRIRKVQLPRDRATWLGLLFVGLVNAALPYTLFAWGEHKMAANASGLASIYNASTPLWTVFLATLFVRSERLSPLRTLGMVVGFGGVVYLFLPALDNIASTDTWGQIACLVAAAMYGIGTLFVRRKLSHLAPIVAAFGQMSTGSLLLLPLVLINDHNAWQVPSLASIGAMLALSIIGTAIAQIIYFGLVKQVGAARTSQVTYLLPIFALTLGSLVLNEPLRGDMLIGLGIILLGVIIVNGKLPVRRKAAPAAITETAK